VAFVNRSAGEGRPRETALELMNVFVGEILARLRNGHLPSIRVGQLALSAQVPRLRLGHEFRSPRQRHLRRDGLCFEGCVFEGRVFRAVARAAGSL